MTRSTPARLYQDRSISTISPSVGRCSMYRWKYHWPRSRLPGLGSATTRTCRGLRCSVIRLIAPPLPAASRPSKMTRTRVPVSATQRCISTSSICRRSSSSLYSFLGTRCPELPLLFFAMAFPSRYSTVGGSLSAVTVPFPATPVLSTSAQNVRSCHLSPGGYHDQHRCRQDAGIVSAPTGCTYNRSHLSPTEKT